jgi:hypothetical protein
MRHSFLAFVVFLLLLNTVAVTAAAVSKMATTSNKYFFMLKGLYLQGKEIKNYRHKI